jgi:3-dehydroquinate synthase
VVAAVRRVDVGDYHVDVTPGVLAEAGALVAAAAPAHIYAVITDANVGPLFGAGVTASLARAAPGARVVYREVPAGESTKTRATWASLSDWLLDERCGRDTTVVALGGGMIGDLAGFVAASLLRGVPFVQVPTSLLAMVDASVGGKVGVDTHQGKNLIGAYHNPALVLVDPAALRSLPARELCAGCAEVIKHGVIADPAALESIRQEGTRLLDSSSHAVWTGAWLTSLIARSIEIKAEIVRADPREAGLRQVLNFGHTVGHAVESASEFRLRHGEAVAIGMAIEARIGEAIGFSESGLTQAITTALDAVHLPRVLPPGLDPDAVLTAMGTDKKRRAGNWRLALPRRLGEMVGSAEAFGVEVKPATVGEALGAA